MSGVLVKCIGFVPSSITMHDRNIQTNSFLNTHTRIGNYTLKVIVIGQCRIIRRKQLSVISTKKGLLKRCSVQRKSGEIRHIVFICNMIRI